MLPRMKLDPVSDIDLPVDSAFHPFPSVPCYSSPACFPQATRLSRSGSTRGVSRCSSVVDEEATRPVCVDRPLPRSSRPESPRARYTLRARAEAKIVIVPSFQSTADAFSRRLDSSETGFENQSGSFVRPGEQLWMVSVDYRFISASCLHRFTLIQFKFGWQRDESRRNSGWVRNGLGMSAKWVTKSRGAVIST